MRINVEMTDDEFMAFMKWRNADDSYRSDDPVYADFPPVASKPDFIPGSVGSDSDVRMTVPDGLNVKSPDGQVQTYVGAVNGIERDRRGLPWDARIHSSNRAKIADGSWRMRRGITDALVASVTKELRESWGMPLPVESTPPPPPVESTPPPPPANPDDVKNLIMATTRLGIPPEKVAEACQSVGLPGVPGLIARPDLAMAVAMILGVTI